jgi:hypothetical protein
MGRHFGNEHEIGYESLITIQEGDLLHTEIQEQKKVSTKEGKMSVAHIVRSLPQVCSVTDKGSESIAQLLTKIRTAQSKVTIERIETPDAELTMAQKVSEIRGQKVYAIVSPLVEVTLLCRGRERTVVAASSWTQEQFAQSTKGMIGAKKGNFVARRVGAQEEQWEVRAGHAYELADSSTATLRMKGKKAFEIKVTGTASIGDMAEQVSRHLKLRPWTSVTIKRADGMEFWVEDQGRYEIETTCDEEADTRLRLKIRHDPPDRTYFVEQIRFDVAKDLNQLFADLKEEIGFELAKPTRRTFTPGPWEDRQEIRITTQEMKLYGSATKEPFRRRTFSIELENGVWQTGEILSPMDANREYVWGQLRLLKELPDLSPFRIVHVN